MQEWGRERNKAASEKGLMQINILTSPQASASYCSVGRVFAEDRCDVSKKGV